MNQILKHGINTHQLFDDAVHIGARPSGRGTLFFYVLLFVIQYRLPPIIINCSFAALPDAQRLYLRIL